jgi:hypothetical protein
MGGMRGGGEGWGSGCTRPAPRTVAGCARLFEMRILNIEGNSLINHANMWLFGAVKPLSRP